MLLITIVVATVSHGLTFEILLISVLFVVFFLLYRLGIMDRVQAVRRRLDDLSHATARIKIRGAFTIMLLFVVLAETLGAEIILGAFVAGAMLSLISTSEDMEATHQLEAVGFGFFIPIFFIMVGANFNLGVLLGSPAALLLLPFLVMAAFLVKLLPALLFRLQFHLARNPFSRLSTFLAALSHHRRLCHRPESGDHQRVHQHDNHSGRDRYRERRPR